MINGLEIDLRSKLGAVRDQGRRPTCLAHALSASHEYARRSDASLSVEYLHYFATGGVPVVGATFAAGTSALEFSGQPEERYCPYTAQGLPIGWKPGGNFPVFRRKSVSVPATLASITAILRRGSAPILGISLPRSFFHPSAPWVIHHGSLSYGLHAVVAVGLGAHRGEAVILVRNSWGAGWGDGGHALLSSDFINNHLREAQLLLEEPSA